MKHFIIVVIIIAIKVSNAANGLDAVHPGWQMANILPEGLDIRVGGIDLFSDGRLAVCEWGNPGNVWIFEGSPSKCFS